MKSLETTSLQATPIKELATRTDFLRANSEVYERLVEKTQTIARGKNEGAVLLSVLKAAEFAREFHSGRFADGAIENVAFEIGAELDKVSTGIDHYPLPDASKENRRRVIHVALSSHLGGHTSLLNHWVRNDQSSRHSVVLTDQGDVPISPRLSEALDASGGDLMVLPLEANLCQKAKCLREIARRGADLVVLHVIWPDVVPTVAFAVPNCPPVAIVDHADHMFWLGSSVADMLINLRTVGSEQTAERRFVPRSKVIPIPLLDRSGERSRWDARRTLGISEDQIMLLSVGRGMKYRPSGPYDFVATVNTILDHQKNAHLYVVGESAKGITPYLRCAVHSRLHFIGRMEDPSLYHAAADIYLESFPFGSQTALLEAALSGIPVVPAYAPLSPMLVANDDALKDVLVNPQDEQEYIKRVEVLIQQPEQRVTLGQTLRQCLLIDHVGKGWLDRLAEIYQETDRLTHRPREIPKSSYSTEDADVGLSLWHVVVDGKTYSMGNSADGMLPVLCHSAFLAKYVGDYEKARWLAWRIVRHNPFRCASWRFLMITLLGRAGKLIRQVLRPDSR